MTTTTTSTTTTTTTNSLLVIQLVTYFLEEHVFELQQKKNVLDLDFHEGNLDITSQLDSDERIFTNGIQLRTYRRELKELIEMSTSSSSLSLDEGSSTTQSRITFLREEILQLEQFFILLKESWTNMQNEYNETRHLYESYLQTLMELNKIFDENTSKVQRKHSHTTLYYTAFLGLKLLHSIYWRE